MKIYYKYIIFGYLNINYLILIIFNDFYFNQVVIFIEEEFKGLYFKFIFKYRLISESKVIVLLRFLFRVYVYFYVF